MDIGVCMLYTHTSPKPPKVAAGGVEFAELLWIEVFLGTRTES